MLNSFKCCAIDAFSAIFRLNSFFIKCTLLFADGFSYIPDKAFIRSAVVFSFTTSCATDLDRVNLITPSSPFLSLHSLRFFPLEAVDATSSHKGNPRFASSKIQSLCHRPFLLQTPFLLPLPLLTLKPNPRL